MFKVGLNDLLISKDGGHVTTAAYAGEGEFIVKAYKCGEVQYRAFMSESEISDISLEKKNHHMLGYSDAHFILEHADEFVEWQEMMVTHREVVVLRYSSFHYEQGMMDFDVEVIRTVDAKKASSNMVKFRSLRGDWRGWIVVREATPELVMDFREAVEKYPGRIVPSEFARVAAKALCNSSRLTDWTVVPHAIGAFTIRLEAEANAIASKSFTGDTSVDRLVGENESAGDESA